MSAGEDDGTCPGLNCDFQKEMLKSQTLIPVKVTLSGKRVSVDGIKITWGHTGWGGGGLNPMTGVLRRKAKFGHRDPGRDWEWHRYKPNKAKKQEAPPGARKRQEGRPQSVRRSRLPPGPWSQVSSLQNHGRITVCCFNHPACCT